jgi:hypothetical protein
MKYLTKNKKTAVFTAVKTSYLFATKYSINFAAFAAAMGKNSP